jgi:MFS family permease
MSTSSQPISDKSTIWSVIWASSVGTLIEWYDFYIFGSLAAIISKQFFPSTNPQAALLSALATFAAGFLVRPFGALVFGRLGDIVGRKYTFMVTLLLMGGATFAIGCVPSFAKIGFAAPIIVLLLRLVQGLAIGGEYGGAATYVAEHTETKDRGFYTSFIQTTATLGLFLSLAVIFFTQQFLGKEVFADWGWRVPFWLSALLVGMSIYIRLNMKESPMFKKVQDEGKVSKNPLAESFGNKDNMKMVLLALFGVLVGQAVVWYTAQFYANSFMQNTLKIEDGQRTMIMLLAITLATPFFIFFATLSDKVGRKWVILGGILAATLAFMPIYKQMDKLATGNGAALVAEKSSTTVVKALMANTTGDSTTVTTALKNFANGTFVKEVKTETKLADATKPAVKPVTAKQVYLNSGDWWSMMGLIFLQILFVTAAYGPMAAFLVELFPARIRYTSLSLPYHVGNGIFGGLTPFIATALSLGGDKFAGLWYPIIIASISLVVGSVFLSNKLEENLN